MNIFLQEDNDYGDLSMTQENKQMDVDEGETKLVDAECGNE